jgi:ribosomal protein S18 acetylase RimI-like enzyme
MVTVSFTADPATHRDAVSRLLAIADEEFVPPLTADSRRDIARSTGEGQSRSIEEYVADCLERPLVVATVDGTVVGFMSIEQIAESEALGEYTPSNHVDLVVVDPEYRGRGIGTELYRNLLTAAPAGIARPYVSTKTWTTNDRHIEILERLDFDLVSRIPDDRADSVDTVYYARRSSSAGASEDG